MGQEEPREPEVASVQNKAWPAGQVNFEGQNTMTNLSRISIGLLVWTPLVSSADAQAPARQAPRPATTAKEVPQGSS
jgi:hypothetical protein